MNTRSKTKRMTDFLTIAGLALAFIMMFIGIVLNEGVDEPLRENYVKYSYNPETGELSDEPELDEEAYNKAMENFLMAEKADIGLINLSLLSGFAHLPSVAITVGGTFAALMIAYPISVFGKFFTYIRIAIRPSEYNLDYYIDEIVELSKEARTKGILSLEDKINNYTDPFFKASLALVVDGMDYEKAHTKLEAMLEKLDDRHAVGRSFMDMGAAFAPGFGLIGTLIGLVNMLGSLDDPNSIGPAMAVALLTTLYGSFLANVIFSPIGNKLSVRHDEEYRCCQLMCTGVEALLTGENPKFIEENLKTLYATSPRKGRAASARKSGESVTA